MIFVRRWANLTQTLCRPCGLAVGADAQSRTMMTGWWGILSALHNDFAAVANAAPGAVVEAAWHLGWGRRHRPRGLVGLGSLDTSAPPTPPSPTSDTSGSVDDSTGAGREDPSDLVGECLSFDSAGYMDDVVPCSTPGAFEVIDVVPDSRDCPSSSSSYMEATTADAGYYDTVCLGT